MLINAKPFILNTSDAYHYLRKHKEELLCTIRCSTRCIHPIDWMTIMPHADAVKWLYWVNEHICLHIDQQSYATMGVMLRIATGMLNKVQSLTDLEKIQIHSNLTHNVHKEYYKLQAEDLPF